MTEPSTYSDAVAAQQKENRQQSLSGMVLIVATIAILFVLPQYMPSPYDCMSMGFGSAALLSACLCLDPDSFRSRRGSLVPALCLVAALWLSAVATSALLLFG